MSKSIYLNRNSASRGTQFHGPLYTKNHEFRLEGQAMTDFELNRSTVREMNPHVRKDDYGMGVNLFSMIDQPYFKTTKTQRPIISPYPMITIGTKAEKKARAVADANDAYNNYIYRRDGPWDNNSFNKIYEKRETAFEDLESLVSKGLLNVPKTAPKKTHIPKTKKDLMITKYAMRPEEQKALRIAEGERKFKVPKKVLKKVEQARQEYMETSTGREPAMGFHTGLHTGYRVGDTAEAYVAGTH